MLCIEEQLTDWGHPDEKLDTEWGYITYLEWNSRVIGRIHTDPARKGKCRISYQPVTGLVCITEAVEHECKTDN